MNRNILAVAVCALSLATACSSGDDDAATTPTTTPGPTESATATISPTTAPGATLPAGVTSVPSRALLVEASSGKVTELFKSETEMAWDARFDGDVVEVFAGSSRQRFNLDGSAAGPGSAPINRCSASGTGVAIDGRGYADVASCGEFSPDGRWMMFRKDAGTFTHPSGYVGPVWDQWVLEVASGTTKELQKGLLHCGGCDARYGPRWSPTSRYVAYAELGGEFRRFLSDVATGATRQIAFGSEVTTAPAWHPTRDELVYSVTALPSGPAVLEDVAGGTTRDLPIAWPVAFDASGEYLYSPAWGYDPKAASHTTTILASSSLDKVAELSGAPPAWLAWRGNGQAVSFAAGGPVAALQGAAGCDGTAIYSSPSRQHCIPDGRMGAINAPGSFAAVARYLGMTGHVKGPGFEALEMARYSIELVDVASGATRTIVPEVVSWDYQAPVIRWNDDGTHLVVLAPSATGL